MQTQTDIANYALLQIPGAGQINDINEGTVPANAAKKWMTSAMKYVLSRTAWNECLKRVALTQGGTPVDDWAYRYLLPSDLVWATKYLDAAGNRLGEGTYALEAQAVHTNTKPLTMVYVYLPTDITILPEQLAQSIGLWLAYLISPNLAGGDFAVRTQIRRDYIDTVGRAILENARARRPAEEPEVWGA